MSRKLMEQAAKAQEVTVEPAKPLALRSGLPNVPIRKLLTAGPDAGPHAVATAIMNHKLMVQFARQHTAACIEFLVRALYHPQAGVMARMKAAELLLAYAWGKPTQAISVAMDAPTPGVGLGAMTIQERVAAVTEAQLGTSAKRMTTLTTTQMLARKVPMAPEQIPYAEPHTPKKLRPGEECV